MRKVLMMIFLMVIAIVSGKAQSNSDTVMILPFENDSRKSEFNWVGESFANSLTDLMDSKEVKATRLNVVSNQERKIIQQSLRIPLTSLPSLATSLKLAKKGEATLLITGKYDIEPAKDDVAAKLTVTAKIIRVNEGRFLSEDFPDGKRITRVIVINDALANLQTIEGQLAFQILYQRDRVLPFKGNDFVDLANKVPARAFEAYIKGLLTPESADSQFREIFFKNALRHYADAKPGATYPDAALELGHLYLNQKKNDEAIDYFSRVIKAIIDCKTQAKVENKVSQCNDESYAEASFYLGLIQWQQKDYEQALAVLRPLADDLKLTSVYNTIGAIDVQAALAEKKNKGKSDAFLKEGLEFLKKAAESAPDESNARFNYGFALFLNNNYIEAAKELRPVLANNSRDGESYFLLAKALEKMGDTSAADFDNQAKRFLTENNQYAKLQTEWRDKQTVNAVNLRVAQPPRKDFVSVVLIKKQATPAPTALNETETLLAQARGFYQSGSDDEAMAVLRRVLVSEPMSAEAYLLLGNIHLRRGDLEQSVSSLKTALFWDNQLIDAHIALGKIYLQKGDCLQAKNYSASAMVIDKENQNALGLERQIERCGK